ncbi:hypothetical protein K439DRAFT_516060 [Ramaria rubella]|nr:hypothetical protein K439DRAFT_516060 [Ramaria rubella]
MKHRIAWIIGKWHADGLPPLQSPRFGRCCSTLCTIMDQAPTLWYDLVRLSAKECVDSVQFDVQSF